MKNKLKELWAKIKIYLPLIASIALVGSMVLGAWLVSRSTQEKHAVIAKADESALTFDSVYDPDGTEGMLRHALMVGANCNLFYGNTSPSGSSLVVNLGYRCIDNVVFSQPMCAPNSYTSVFNICQNSYCPLDYDDYSISFWVDDSSDEVFYIYDGAEYKPMNSVSLPSSDGVRKYWYADFFWMGSETLAVLGFEGGSLTLNNLNVVYSKGQFFAPLPTLEFTFNNVWDFLGSGLYLSHQDIYNAAKEHCLKTHTDIYDDGYHYGHLDGYDLGYKDAYDNYADTWVCPDCTTEYQNGYENGHDVGYKNGHDVGYKKGLSEAYDVAYEKLREEVETEVLQDKDTFMDLIFGIMDAPIRIIRDVFNFEIFGINVSDTVFFFLTAVIVVFVIKKIRGG